MGGLFSVALGLLLPYVLLRTLLVSWLQGRLYRCMVPLGFGRDRRELLEI